MVRLLTVFSSVSAVAVSMASKMARSWVFVSDWDLVFVDEGDDDEGDWR